MAAPATQSTTSAAVGVPTRTAFLDTNGLLELSLYWETCQAASVTLDSVLTYASLKSALPRRYRGFQPARSTAQAVGRGQKLFHQLWGRRNDWDYYTSAICRAEMHHVLLEQSAQRSLTGMRIPQRLRSDRPLLVFRQTLQTSDYTALDQKLSDFFDDLRLSYGVDIKTAEDLSSLDERDVRTAAKIIWSHVLMEVMDAFIFGCAVVTFSETLVTRDGPFLEAVNQLAGSTESRWRNARASIAAAIGTPPGFIFPRAIKPQDALPA